MSERCRHHSGSAARVAGSALRHSRSRRARPTRTSARAVGWVGSRRVRSRVYLFGRWSRARICRRDGEPPPERYGSFRAYPLGRGGRSDGQPRRNGLDGFVGNAYGLARRNTDRIGLGSNTPRNGFLRLGQQLREPITARPTLPTLFGLWREGVSVWRLPLYASRPRTDYRTIESNHPIKQQCPQ